MYQIKNDREGNSACGYKHVFHYAVSFQTHGLMFEQQKEIMLLQMEDDKSKHELKM